MFIRLISNVLTWPLLPFHMCHSLYLQVSAHECHTMHQPYILPPYIIEHKTITRIEASGKNLSI